MTRNLKIAFAAAIALTAFGALAASGAQATEFHCSVEPCRVTMKPDGAVPSKTAHHVYVIQDSVGQSFSTTCNAITGEGTLNTKTSSELSIGNLKGEGCVLGGEPEQIRSNGCAYLFKSAGTLTITCPAGKVIENEGSWGCSYNIPPQGPLNGITYHTIGGGSETTVEIAVSGISVTTNEGCLLKPPVTASFTTGNVLLTSETDPGGVMANMWWE